MAYQCDICEKTFKRKKQLKEHERFHTNNLFVCDAADCTSKFDAQYKLNLHLKRHQSIKCFTCGKQYNGVTYKSHKCGSDPGPKPIHQALQRSNIENIAREINKLDEVSPYPLNRNQVKGIIEAEGYTFRESKAKHAYHANIAAIDTFTEHIGYETRKNKHRRRIFAPITDRQIICRAKNDDEIYQHVSQQEYSAIQHAYPIIKRKKRTKRRERATRDVDYSHEVMTLKERQKKQEAFKKRKKKKKRIQLLICNLCKKEAPVGKGEFREEDDRWYCDWCNINEPICCDECNEVKKRSEGQYYDGYFQCFHCFSQDYHDDVNVQTNEADAHVDVAVDQNIGAAPLTDTDDDYMVMEYKYTCGECSDELKRLERD
eukprot:785246_1